MAEKSYASIYDIKNFAMKELIPFYFGEEASTSSLGMIGYSTELISTLFEDAFNTMAFIFPEMYPNKARMPETIYTYSALYKYNDIFAVAAKTPIVLFISEADILTKGTTKSDGTVEFYLDRDLVITVNKLDFMMDYNVKITAREYHDQWVFQARYDKTFDGNNFNNSISDVNSPYLKSKRVNINNQKYLMINVDTHQVNKEIFEDSIISNDILNVPSLQFEYEGDLCGFNVFYRESSSKQYRQLETLLFNSLPISADFCLYKAVNENKIEITFTTRDGYFQPEFGSEIYIEYYTTKGPEGNFKKYSGDDINIVTKSENYDYNNGLILFGSLQTESIGGLSKPTLSNLKNKVCELFTTVGSITSEKDLEVYFSNFANTYNNKMKFIKLRDDYLKRVHSAFVLLKDSKGEIYNTNTLTIRFAKDDFDTEYEQTNRYMIEPGRVFKYRASNSNVVIPVGKEKVTEIDLDALGETNLYSLPFLTYISKKPQSVAFYINSINNVVKMDYKLANENSFVQFICNGLTITRDAIVGEKSYHVKCMVSPSTDQVDECVTITEDGEIIDNGILKLKLFVQNGYKSRVGYIDLNITNYEKDTMFYTFEGDLKTDDYITDGNEMRLTNLLSTEDGSVIESAIIPMVDTVFEVATFYKAETNLPHEFDNMADVRDMTLTNIYIAEDEKATLIQPIDIISSTMTYEDLGDTYGINLELVPLISAYEFQEKDYGELIDNIVSQYNYMALAKKYLINNFNINLKFYNTYGHSKNFYAGENQVLLDNVNCKISYAVKAVPGANTEELINDIKIFIKEFIESINSSSSNSIFISNLTTALERNFSDISYMKFIGINDFDSSIQSLSDFTNDNLDVLNKSERMLYVPEFLTIKLSDINISLIE